MGKTGVRWTREQYEAWCQKQAVREGMPLPSPVQSNETPKNSAPAKVRKKREMNATETGFYAIQQARVRKGELIECIYEPVSFSIGGGVRYKVDFMLRYPDNRLEFVEIKGRKIWTQDLVRYKIAADRWGWLGEFQLWQGIRGNYERIR